MTKRALVDEIARDAADRVSAAHAAGEQLELMPDDAAPIVDRGPGGDTRGRGRDKATSQMRDWLLARGYRMPEDVLAEMAGLASSADAIETALARTERILEWAAGDAHATVWDASKQRHLTLLDADGNPKPFEFAPDQRLAAFEKTFAMQLRAAEAAMPYVAAKRTPDVNVNAPVTQIVMPTPAARPGDDARVVNADDVRMRPPPMPHETEQNQSVSDAGAAQDRSDARSDEVSR